MLWVLQEQAQVSVVLTALMVATAQGMEEVHSHLEAAQRLVRVAREGLWLGLVRATEAVHNIQEVWALVTVDKQMVFPEFLVS